MARVLLVENEGVWLELIRQALPEYDVDQAQSFDKALALLDGEAAYDVAIVDLNLLPRGSRDKLGGRLLDIMRDRYPTIRRIVLTGEPPTAVKAVFDQYDPDDLLLKAQMDLSVVRSVVETALTRAAGGVPDRFRFEKLELRNVLHSWEESILLRLTQQAQTFQNDIEEAERVGKQANDSETALEALEAKRQDLEAKCADLGALIASIRSVDDQVRARDEFEKLKAVFGA
jgi:CheY-like chemotaxis protein